MEQFIQKITDLVDEEIGFYANEHGTSTDEARRYVLDEVILQMSAKREA